MMCIFTGSDVMHVIAEFANVRLPCILKRRAGIYQYRHCIQFLYHALDG